MAGKVQTSEVLRRTAHELESLSALTRDLECTVTQLMQSGGTQSGTLPLQGFDLVTQTLAALTDFVTEIGDQMGGTHRTDIDKATRNITLGDLRARLQDVVPTGAVQRSPELF